MEIEADECAKLDPDVSILPGILAFGMACGYAIHDVHKKDPQWGRELTYVLLGLIFLSAAKD